jgi:hypothetical protein
MIHPYAAKNLLLEQGGELFSRGLQVLLHLQGHMHGVHGEWVGCADEHGLHMYNY